MLLEQLQEAQSVTLAVAYFLPDERTLKVLESVPELKLFYSEEYVINDPARLERLARSAHVAGVPTDTAIGKLHAKVALCTKADGTQWALVGSANLTSSGLFRNSEACIAIDSSDLEGAQAIQEIEKWLRMVEAHARETKDWTEARRIHAAQERYRLEPRDKGPPQIPGGLQHWVLKTRSGHTGEDHWSAFQAEQVLAIGWDDIKVNPALVSEAQLRADVQRAYPSYGARKVARVATKLRRFHNMRPGDRVLILRGYNVQQDEVFIYGVARVEGPAFEDSGSRWWRFKYPALIQPLEIEISRDVVAKALGKKTLLEAIHEIDGKAFDSLAQALRQETGNVLYV